MAKFIQLINLDEIKALRITCEKCHSYWSVISLGGNEFPRKCNYCKGEKDVIPSSRAERLKKLVQEIEWAQNGLENFRVSIELETEK
ncbi:hypothetical protein KA005_67555 [bacterium]|nr:hypothetical protein [bacterium]